MKRNIVVLLAVLCLLCFALFIQAAENQPSQNQNANPIMIYSEDDWEDITLLALAKHQRRLQENKQAHEKLDDPFAFYSDFKESVEKIIGLQFGADISFTAQRLSHIVKAG